MNEPQSSTTELQQADDFKELIGLINQLNMKEEDWHTIVLDILRAYVTRSKWLSDWWVWTRFYATFGRLTPDAERYDTWKASNSLDALLRCHMGLELYRSRNWLWRLFNRKLYRQAMKEQRAMLDTLLANELAWCDRKDFANFRNAKGR